MIDFAAPAAAAFGLIGALIVAQYFLKLRRVRRTIPSTFLWKRAARRHTGKHALAASTCGAALAAADWPCSQHSRSR